MSALPQIPDFLDQHDKIPHSYIVQEPDDYFVRKARGNVLDVLDFESHSQHKPANISSTAQILPKRVMKFSETIDQIDANRVVPPANSRFLDKARDRLKRTLVPTTEWEGYIESMTENEFSVRMIDVRSNSPLPVEQATFHKDEVSEYDRKFLMEGAIVRWIIGRERLPTGQVRNVSELYFRRLPAHSEKDYKRAYEKACSLLEGIIWDNEARNRRD